MAKKTLTVTPTTIALRAPTPVHFAASEPVTWALNYGRGTLTAGAIYTPPPTQDKWETVTVRATSVADPSRWVEVPVKLGPYQVTHPAPPPVVVPPPDLVVVPPAKTPRPRWNTGRGLFVAGGKLYDANGVEFRIRGVNRLHWDGNSPGLAKSGANTVRWDVDFRRPAASNVALLGTHQRATRTIVMPSNWEGTCKEDPSYLTRMVDTWVEQMPHWLALLENMILNIANEWGAVDSTVWRDAYITAIARLRAAGWLGCIAVTSGGCGQDRHDLIKHARAVFDSDPEKNVIFDLHVYGSMSDDASGVLAKWNGQSDIVPALKEIAALGLPVIIGEFGPGRAIGPSPTMIAPLRVIELAERHGFGWLAWAWDDNDKPNGMSDDNWFSMSYSGKYETSADLTLFGRQVVEDPKLGLKALARPATTV